MKPTIVIAIVAAASIMAGCESFNQNHVFAAKQAATTITRELLIEHPDWRDEFEQAQAELLTLSTRELITAQDILAIIQRLPSKELNSRGARLAFDGANVIIYIAGAPAVPATASNQLKQVAAGLAAGISEGFKQL